MTGDRWYQTQATDLPAAVAYFSPEFGITAALPQYSGGLGILAGDHLKAASDLGVPLIGVGPALPARLLPPDPVPRGLAAGALPGPRPQRTARRPAARGRRHARPGLPGPARRHARCTPASGWPRSAGSRCCMLDSDVEENDLGERGVTDRLYGGGSEHRLLQEMLLGIGGVRAVRTYCRLTGHPEPEVFHTNEGHAGFLGLERIAELCDAGTGLRLRAGGGPRRDRLHHPHPRPGRHRPLRPGTGRPPLRRRRANCRGSTSQRILQLGMETYPGGEPNLFNMAVMGLRLAQRANGVSLLHGQVSREMFSGLWPGFDPEEVPITSVTNGVHAPDLGGPRGLPARRPADRRAAHRGRADRRRLGPLGRGRGHPRPGDLGPAPGPARAAGDGGARAAARLLAAARRGHRRTRLDRRRARPRRPHHRLRAPRPLVQAADADAARPRPADGPAPAPRAARSRSSSPARRTPRTTAASGWSRSWCGSPTTPGCATASSSCPTTGWRWRRSSTRAATSG